MKNSQMNIKVSDNGVSFMLAEYSHLSELLKHTDDRLTATLNLFLTVATVTISAAVFLAQSTVNIKLFIALLIPVTLLLATAGTFLSYRIVRTRMLKAEYICAINLIRALFVHLDQSLQSYVLLPVDDEQGTWLRERFDRKRGFRDYLNFIHLCSGIFVGFSVTAGLWLIYSAVALWLLNVGGTLISVLYSYWLSRSAQNITRQLESLLQNRQKNIRHLVRYPNSTLKDEQS